MVSVRFDSDLHAPIAQLDRAFGYGPKGCGFDLCWARQGFVLKNGAFCFVKNTNFVELTKIA